MIKQSRRDILVVNVDHPCVIDPRKIIEYIFVDIIRNKRLIDMKPNDTSILESNPLQRSNRIPPNNLVILRGLPQTTNEQTVQRQDITS
jgi:hypothetical protein